VAVISRSRRILFVHIQKTGGGSIEALLRARLPDLERCVDWHAHASAIKRQLGQQYSDYYTFSFVRNPWDRMVSWYFWLKNMADRGKFFWTHKFGLPHHATFEQFILQARGVLLHPQCQYIADADGTFLVNVVYRFENFRAECRKLGGALGLSFGRIPHHRHTIHKHYSHYYSPELRDVVAKRFAPDGKAFGYEF